MSTDHKRSARRRCALLTLTRSTLYYPPKGESVETLQFMEIPETVFRDAVEWVTSNGPTHEAEQPQVRPPPFTTLDAPHAIGSDLPESQYHQEALSAQEMAIFAQAFSDQPAKPSRVC